MQRTILGPGRRGGSWPSWVTEAQAEFDGIFHSSDYNRTVSYDSLIRHVHLNTRSQIFCCATLATAIPELNTTDAYFAGALIMKYLEERFGSSIHARLLEDVEPTFAETLFTVLGEQGVTVPEAFYGLKTWLATQVTPKVAVLSPRQ